MVRAPYFDKNGVKKGAWSAEEDDMLRSYISKYGPGNWRQLPKLAGLQRCGKSCRLRWVNYLRQDVKLGSYTKEEDDLVFKLHAKFGNKWSKIAARLPGRTDNDIKNHWHTLFKKRTKGLEGGLQSSEGDSRGDFAQNRSNNESETRKSTVCDVPPYPILESFPLPQPGDSSEIGTNYSTAGDTLGSVLEKCQDLTSIWDFGTEPCVWDNCMYNQYCQSSSFEVGFLPSYAPYCEDDQDLLYQVMNELPYNW